MAVLLSDSFARTDQPLYLSYADTGQQWNCDPTSATDWGVEGGKLLPSIGTYNWAAIPRNSAARYFRCALATSSQGAGTWHVLYIYPWSPDGTNVPRQTFVEIRCTTTLGIYAILRPAGMDSYTTEIGAPHTDGQSHIIEIYISTSNELVVAIDDTVLGLVHMTQAAIDSTFNGQYLYIRGPFLVDWIDDVLMTDQAIPGGGGGSPDDPGDGSGSGTGVGTWIITGSVDW